MVVDRKYEMVLYRCHVVVVEYKYSEQETRMIHSELQEVKTANFLRMNFITETSHNFIIREYRC